MIKEDFRNKMIKHYWADCLDKDTGHILLDRIDGDNYFGGILTNDKGRVELDVTEFISLISRVIDATEQYLEKK